MNVSIVRWLRKTVLATTLFPVLAATAQNAGPTPDKPANPEEKPKLEAKFFLQSTPHAGDITRGILIAETNQFSFVVPGGFRQRVDVAGKKISLISPNFNGAITATIHEFAIEGKVELNPETLKAQVLSRQKNAQLVDEFRASIESMNGPAFEIEWPSGTGKMATRIAFVPYAGGYIEFTVQASAEEFRSYDQPFSQLLMSFRTSPAGEKLPLQQFLSEL